MGLFTIGENTDTRSVVRSPPYVTIHFYLRLRLDCFECWVVLYTECLLMCYKNINISTIHDPFVTFLQLPVYLVFELDLIHLFPGGSLHCHFDTKLLISLNQSVFRLLYRPRFQDTTCLGVVRSF